MIGKDESTNEKLIRLGREYKNVIVVLILGGIVALTFILLTVSAQNNINSEDVEPIEEIANVETETVDTFVASEKVDNQKVYISGEVVNPGVYEIALGDRIEDIINYAGGVTEKANITYINLAEIVTDEQHIIIPNKEEANLNNDNTNTSTNTTRGKININKANISELTQLTGVGEATAGSIIEYRETNGKFNKIEDIKKVSGIGDKTFEKFKDEIDVK